MAKNSEKNTTSFALQFVGSLLFLAVVWQLFGVASAPANWGTGLTSGAFWATIFFAVGVFSTVTLLFTSFAQLGNMGGMASWKAMKAATTAGFALVLLTVTNPTLLVATLVGLALASYGSAVAMKNYKDSK